MNSTINTYESLISEKARLERLLEEQKLQLRKDFTLFKDQLEHRLEPASKLLNTVDVFTGHNGAKPILNFGLGLGVDMLLRNTLFKKAGFITKIAAPFLLRTFTKNITNEMRGGFLQIIGNLFRKNDKLA
jgi:hypothetical protein